MENLAKVCESSSSSQRALQSSGARSLTGDYAKSTFFEHLFACTKIVIFVFRESFDPEHLLQNKTQIKAR